MTGTEWADAYQDWLATYPGEPRHDEWGEGGWSDRHLEDAFEAGWNAAINARSVTP